MFVLIFECWNFLLNHIKCAYIYAKLLYFAEIVVCK